VELGAPKRAAWLAQVAGQRGTIDQHLPQCGEPAVKVPVGLAQGKKVLASKGISVPQIKASNSAQHQLSPWEDVSSVAGTT